MHPIKSTDDFTSLLNRLGLPDDIIGYFLGVSKLTVRNWRNGHSHIPSEAIIELTELVRVIEGWFLWLEKRA